MLTCQTRWDNLFTRTRIHPIAQERNSAKGWLIGMVVQAIVLRALAVTVIGVWPVNAQSSRQALPLWRLERDLAIGLSAGEKDDFHTPNVAGIDSAGSIYVWDMRLLEIRRFDSLGRFQNVVARKGRGPGEISAPVSIAVEKDRIRLWDAVAGRLIWLSPTGNLLRSIQTNLTAALPPRTSVVVISANTNKPGFVVMRSAEDPPKGEISRPLVTRSFFSVSETGQVLNLLHEYRMPGRTLHLDGGRSTIRYPDPDDSPIVWYDASRRLFTRIDRAIVPPPKEASLRFQLIDANGTVLRARRIPVTAVPFQSQTRDSLWKMVVRAATFDGARTLDRTAAQTLERTIVWPRYWPAVTTAVPGLDGSIWLKRANPNPNSPAEWLVVDSLFNAIARAIVPSGVSNLGFRMGRGWGTETTREGIPFVARFRIAARNR